MQNINGAQYERRHPEYASKVPKRCYSFPRGGNKRGGPGRAADMKFRNVYGTR